MSVGPVPWKNVVKNAAAEKLFAEIQALPVLLKQSRSFILSTLSILHGNIKPFS